jgi:tRNA(Ile)-lysidine synthase
MPSGLAGAFAAAMAQLGPFEPRPRLAVAVSGGADSLSLTLLARDWAAERGGTVLGLTVDHGLRPESAAEAALTLTRLTRLGVTAECLTVRGLARGPGLAERARAARYDALLDRCAAAGVLHLLLGHHRSDQVETVMMRALSGSGTRGLAGMAALTETRFTRLLRPLLGIPPAEARSFLMARGIDWVEDPSNRDPSARRARVRMAIGDPDGVGAGTLALAGAIHRTGLLRAERDAAIARKLAGRVTLWPEGFAYLTPGPIDPDALAALIRVIGGADHAPAPDRVAALARAPAPRTLGGVRIAQGGRFGPGWLLTREPRGLRGPVAARRNARWDGRFRLTDLPADAPADVEIAALGDDARRFRDRRGPPPAVLHGLPAIRTGETLIAAPHIGVGPPEWRFLFDPGNPLSGAPFAPG